MQARRDNKIGRLASHIFIAVPLLVSPTMGTEFTYKEYAKASEVWKRGFVFGISRYMSGLAPVWWTVEGLGSGYLV
jgi:hypothetical protein